MSSSRQQSSAPGQLAGSLRAPTGTASDPSTRLPMAGHVNVLQGTCDEDLPVLAATDKARRELLERHQAAGARRMERRRALRRQRNDGRKRSGVACRGRDLAATLRYRSPPRPPGEGSTTGTAQRALALEPCRFRYAYRAGHAARRRDVTRSIENRMDTITSMAQAREDAPFSLRTSRTCTCTPLSNRYGRHSWTFLKK